ncbi:hypothetical protein [Reinekea sp. G2M2-21]|jgi:hypothetical protein|uniref:hypothetical protein n=1 Tax=Reinekea sp. G2M2-21 TaxID=2788942 RepID=UPI0018A97570|nr:hypothetical protein [Reinekea sp. G2M2-21]MDX1342937.1 hypothetical protein [Reinekea sp.]
MIDYVVNDRILRIENDIYEVDHIKDVFVIKHNRMQQFIRQLLLGLQLALAGGIASLWLGPPAIIVSFALFAIGVIYGITTCEQIELRARFAGTDETGDQIVPLFKARDDDQLEALFCIYDLLKQRLLSLPARE